MIETSCYRCERRGPDVVRWVDGHLYCVDCARNHAKGGTMTVPKNLGGRRVLGANGNPATMVDADKELSVLITDPDVAVAVCGDPDRCAIAQAIMRHYLARGRVVFASVGAKYVYVQDGDKITRYLIPRNEGSLIAAFDRVGAFPAPFRVTLKPPQQSDRLGQRNPERGRKNPDAPHRRVRRLPTRHLRAPHIWPDAVPEP